MLGICGELIARKEQLLSITLDQVVRKEEFHFGDFALASNLERSAGFVEQQFGPFPDSDTMMSPNVFAEDCLTVEKSGQVLGPNGIDYSKAIIIIVVRPQGVTLSPSAGKRQTKFIHLTGR